MPSDTTFTDQRTARGDHTRKWLLGAGLALFSARGYDAGSTRDLAQAADANQAPIPYHFGGKAQLYVTVAEDLAGRAHAALAPLIDAPSGATPAILGPAAAAAQLAAALGVVVRGLLALTGAGTAAAFVLREQTHPGPGFEPLYAGYLRPVHEHVTGLVARATGRPADDAAAVVDAHALIGMALGFALALATLLRRAGWDAYTPARVEQVAAQVAALALRALGLAAPGDRRPDARTLQPTTR